MESNNIKFRAWDKFNGEYYYSELSGSLVKFFTKLSIATEGGNEIIVEQWTGLQDEDKRDVYEGDIMIVDGRRFVVVVWHEQAGAWDTNFISDRLPAFPFNSLKNANWGIRAKVIGNRNQDPKLLLV